MTRRLRGLPRDTEEPCADLPGKQRLRMRITQPDSSRNRSSSVCVRSGTDGLATVQNNGRTTRPGGTTGSGFVRGQSGNPGGRPKGLSRRVRELVGDDGEAIAVYMLSVMRDEKARTADRLEAAKWLADRGLSLCLVSNAATALRLRFRSLFRSPLLGPRAGSRGSEGPGRRRGFVTASWPVASPERSSRPRRSRSRDRLRAAGGMHSGGGCRRSRRG